MLTALLILVAAAGLCALLGALPGERWRGAPGYAALLGGGAALLAALLSEGLEGTVLGSDIEWPAALEWLGQPLFRSDALGAGLGAWCLFLGWLSVIKLAGEEGPPGRLAVALLTTAAMYSLVHTSHFLALAAQTLLVVALIWAYQALAPSSADGEKTGVDTRGLLTLGFGALSLLGSAALIGRTTGGNYDLSSLPLPALSPWPTILLVGFVLLWVGAAPFTGWSASGRGASSALLQAVVLGIPVLAVVLRLQVLVTTQGLVGSLPPEWNAFTGTLAWLGALTALAGATSTLLRAGTGFFMPALTACYLGLAIWALGLDTPAGRQAAVALVIAYGAGRIAWELSGGLLTREEWGGLPRAAAALSLAAAPLSAGFTSIWLLGVALVEVERASLVLLVIGVATAAACGLVLHLRAAGLAERRTAPYVDWAAVVLASALAVGGVLPGLWLPVTSSVAAVMGGLPLNGVSAGLVGLSAQTGRGAAPMEAPLLWLALGVVLLAAIGWLVLVLKKRGAPRSGALLPTAIERLQHWSATSGGTAEAPAPPLAGAPTPLRWTSLGWLSSGFGTLGGAIAGAGIRAGSLMGRLEGRFYLSLALVLALVLLLAVTR